MLYRFYVLPPPGLFNIEQGRTPVNTNIWEEPTSPSPPTIKYTSFQTHMRARNRTAAVQQYNLSALPLLNSRTPPISSTTLWGRIWD